MILVNDSFMDAQAAVLDPAEESHEGQVVHGIMNNTGVRMRVLRHLNDSKGVRCLRQAAAAAAAAT